MAAWVIALAKVHVVFLGADTPLSEVASAMERHGARAVALSVAAGYAGDLDATVATFCAALAPDAKLVLGGAGVAKVRANVGVLNSFEDLFDWAVALASSPLSGQHQR